MTAVTSLHLFRVRSRDIPAALVRMAADRRALARTPGLAFWKLFGTGRTFAPRDADPRTWGLLGVWEDPEALVAFERSSSVSRGWRRLATTRWRADLRLIASRGRWSGREPFGTAGVPPPPGTPVAALTRARLRARLAPTFWRAVPPVTDDLRTAPGLRFALGIGEAPLAVQGTFSLWASEEALRTFAYRRSAHRTAIRQTAELGWYAEELFARFAVLRTTGALPPEAG